MINYFSLIFISIILIKCTIVQIHPTDNRKESCVENPFQRISANNFTVCYLNDIESQSIVVWFINGKIVNETFDYYRFVLRSIDNSISSNIIIKSLTNFTKLIDFKNSLRMFNLESSQYEVCIEFQSNFSRFVYQPRDGCISIPIGELSHQSFKQCSTALPIALASGIVLFFILGLIVQWAKKKRQNNNNGDDNNETRLRSSSILSTISLRQQSDRVIRNLFHRYIDQPRSSRLRQWARSRAFRHRILTQDHEFEKSTYNQSPQPSSTINKICTISGQ